MSRKYLFILLLVHSVLSDECVRYVFEDYNELFTTEVPTCTGQGFWSYETYYESIYEAPNEKSEFFIKPLNINTVSCTGSFTFAMMPGGLVEVMVYIERGSILSLTVILLQRQDVIHPTVGEARLGDDVANGWHVIRLTNSIRDEPFQGYVGFLGSASDDSVLIVDSFRYIPLNMDPEEECILYEDIIIPEPDTTTTEATTTPTTEDTTTPTTEATTTPITTPATTETTTIDSSTEVTTESPSTDSGVDSDPFWTPLVITITVIVCFIVLVIVAALSYYVGSLVAKKKIKVEDDINYNYDVPQILPRVNRVYPEINSNKYNTGP